MKNSIFTLLLLCTTMLYAQHSNVRTTAQNTHTQVQTPIKVGDEVALNLQTAHPYNTTNQTGIIFEQEFYNKNSAYIKLYFEDFDLGPGDYVEISTHNTGASIIYGGQGKIIDQNGTMISTFWSQALLDERVTVRLHAVTGTNSHQGFKISRVAYGYSEAQIEALAAASKSICGADNKERIACYSGTDMYNKSRAVCRLLMNGSGLCTGWLLGSEGHVMTNEHCIGNASTAANTDFMFNYQYSSCTGSGNASSVVVASSSTFIKTNSSLDYTLVKLPVNPTSTYGYLQLSTAAPSVGDRIYIVQHPGGRRKEIAVKTDQGGTSQGFAMINSTSGTGARYYADTEGGSSGSPVLDYNSNLVVAIHNTGGCTNGSYGRSDQLIPSIGSDMPADGYPGFGGGGTPTGCATTVSNFPYTESFENTIGAWTQASGDDFNWTTRSGGTPSNNTGPSAANSGNYYVYMESSTPNYSTKNAILNSPCFNLSGQSSPQVSFKYHMYGATNMGNLLLQASTNGTNWTTVWSKSGNQGNNWETATVSLATYANETELRLRFNGTTGTTWQGDMAVDAFSMTTGGGGTGGGCVDVDLNFIFDNYPEETSWTIRNSAGSTVANGGTYGSQADGSALTISECLDAGCYTLTINDSYGDGICCAYGNGSYSLTSGGSTLASGGQFTSSVSHNFCLGESGTLSAIDDAVVNETGTFLNVMPNPFSNYINVQTNIGGNFDYSVTNVQGQQVAAGQLQGKTIQLDELNPGVYFITFSNDKKHIVKKLIKQ
ncbi:MAG: trypsin-like peptidase domain-containing protein [Aureispira sp.]